MPEKYPPHRIVTNDLYLAAYLLCTGSRLCGVVRNDRRRVSFIVAGEHVHRLRAQYRGGMVRLNMRSFRDSLITIRRRMDTEQRSAAHESTGKPDAQSPARV